MSDHIEAIFEGKEAEKFLESVKKKSKTLEQGSRELGGIISGTVYRDITEHFQSEEGPDGAWTAWSDIYATHMDRIGHGNNKILQNTGTLRQGFQPSNYRAVGGGILFFNRAKTKGGFPYAFAHDTGGPQLPRRKFMWLSDVAMESISEQCLRWVADVS